MSIVEETIAAVTETVDCRELELSECKPSPMSAIGSRIWWILEIWRNGRKLEKIKWILKEIEELFDGFPLESKEGDENEGDLILFVT